jgi:hypothetical protein
MADEVIEKRCCLLRRVKTRWGAKRTWRDVSLLVRFRGEADIPRCILTIMSDANDPQRT